MDTLQAIADTTQTHIDTVIHKIMYENDIYREMLASQHETYSNMLTIFFIIISVVLTGNFLYNFIYSKRKIESSVKKGIEKLTAEVNEETSKFILSSNKIMNAKIKTNDDKVTAAIHHIQGFMAVQAKHFPVALLQFYLAANLQLKVDRANFNRALINITEICLHKLTKSEIQHLIDFYKVDIPNLVKEMDAIDEEGIFDDIIINIKLKYNEALKREKLPDSNPK
ncbi:MAG: hypothetical protein HQ510_07105 [Candidatus Marinimicrobia bacterium]|nr:hypothetical protein [Candidatus Neomarinimicrobiota bacterium]